MPKLAFHIGHKYARLSYRHNSRENENHANILKDFSEYNSLELLGLDNSEQATQERLNTLYNQAKSNFEKTLRKNPKNKIIKKGKNAGKPNGFQHFTPKKHATKEMILELPQIEIKKGDDPKKIRLIYDKLAENCAKEICDLFKIKAIQFTIHRDEGYICDKNKNVLKCHQHAHLVAFTLDENTGYQKFKKGESKKKEYFRSLGGIPKLKLDKKSNSDIYATFNARNLSKAQEIVYKYFGHFENVEKQEKTFGIKDKKSKKYNKDYRNYKKKKIAERSKDGMSKINDFITQNKPKIKENSAIYNFSDLFKKPEPNTQDKPKNKENSAIYNFNDLFKEPKPRTQEQPKELLKEPENIIKKSIRKTR